MLHHLAVETAIRRHQLTTPLLQNLDTFSSLKILSIQSNRITKMEGLEGLVNLEELYLSHNGLMKIEGLEKNVSGDCGGEAKGEGPRWQQVYISCVYL